ncbi:hypothetical protein L873DRAFT_1819495 [Choiromyces venosus 120613-1]|uniref:Uncharacterized protein n=1 Tax=Choiromyces venosus 120613-1 TaxID=1336337 RepID=A0A3N4J499_9PEZI|nr:hypothetical protein L873DRAFT_1819495 [Choiromyces venosus 120613-1]
MSLQKVNGLGFKFNAFLPIQSLGRDLGITKTVSELITNGSKVVDRTPKLEFEDNLDRLNGV